MQIIGFKAVTLIGMSLTLGMRSCGHNEAAAPVYQAQPGDPANANMAPVQGYTAQQQPARVLDRRDVATPYESGEQYPQQQNYNPGENAYDEADQAPPPLPEYAQPPATRPNTIWTPGYWGHAPNGYYWVPGAWVAPPRTGQLWTPGYWASNGPRYQFHPGYWGPHVGFYGGVPYGQGYNGTGYRGGYWNGNRFNLNQAVNRYDPNEVRDVYNQPEPMSYPYGRASYNGPGGIALLPIAAELLALHEQHERPIRYQLDLDRQSAQNRAQFFNFNHGRPEIYYANDNYYVNRPEPRQVIIERPIIVEQRNGPPGHAYGLYKEHGNKHDEGDGGDRGDKHDHGDKHDRGDGDKHGGKHDRE